ncbi:lipopolysaccharide biosynthesis protein [Candidatus Desantisbacteria bacterium]|nr:lipopolysaccharide biosynthesis protein [Candidatus Desantisbacteria bacterium]
MEEDRITAFDIKTKIVKSLKWTILMEIVIRLIQPVTILFLTRILSPSDFGLVGVATIIIGFSTIFQDFGLGKTLIQREQDIEKSANIVFWTNIGLSLFIYIILYISAPLLSGFFHEQKVVNVLRVLCLQIILSGFISVHQALLQRKFQFKQLFIIKICTAFVPVLFSIPLALKGYGVWALIIGTLAGGVIQIIIYWKISPWRPELSYDFIVARQLIGFSSWVTSDALLSWLVTYGDSIMIGHSLNIKEMGIYRIGTNIVVAVIGIFMNPFLPVVYSAFSRLQSNLPETKQLFMKMTKFISAISLFVGFGLAVFAYPISKLIFGQKWHGIEIVIICIGIKEAISWIVGINSAVYTAVGRPDLNSRVHVIQLLWYLPLYIFFPSFGLEIFCIAYICAACISMFLHIYYSNKILDYGWIKLIKNIRILLIATLLSVTAVLFSHSIFGIPFYLFDLLINGIIFVLIYFLVIFLNDRKFILNLFDLARNSMAK